MPDYITHIVSRLKRSTKKRKKKKGRKTKKETDSSGISKIRKSGRIPGSKWSNKAIFWPSLLQAEETFQSVWFSAHGTFLESMAMRCYSPWRYPPTYLLAMDGMLQNIWRPSRELSVIVSTFSCKAFLIVAIHAEQGSRHLSWRLFCFVIYPHKMSLPFPQSITDRLFDRVQRFVLSYPYEDGLVIHQSWHK